jgi:hypothetical protein
LSWQDDATTIIRALISDTDETNPTYSDDRIEELSCVGARQVICELPQLAATYTVDLDNVEISPDPTGRNDQSFVNLFCLKARLTILEGEAKKAANQAIAIKDGASSVDLRDIAKQKSALAKQAKADYDQAKLEWRMYGGTDGTGGMPAGHAVVGPVRAYGYPYHTSNTREF